MYIYKRYRTFSPAMETQTSRQTDDREVTPMCQSAYRVDTKKVVHGNVLGVGTVLGFRLQHTYFSLNYRLPSVRSCPAPHHKH